MVESIHHQLKLADRYLLWQWTSVDREEDEAQLYLAKTGEALHAFSERTQTEELRWFLVIRATPKARGASEDTHHHRRRAK